MYQDAKVGLNNENVTLLLNLQGNAQVTGDLKKIIDVQGWKRYVHDLHSVKMTMH